MLEIGFNGEFTYKDYHVQLDGKIQVGFTARVNLGMATSRFGTRPTNHGRAVISDAFVQDVFITRSITTAFPVHKDNLINKGQ